MRCIYNRTGSKIILSVWRQRLTHIKNFRIERLRLDEQALVQLAVRRDIDAWELLVRAHQEVVFRLAYLFCADPDEAEDLSQETFIRAYRHIDQFDASRPLRPWVLGIAANLARNRLRSAGRYLAALSRFASKETDQGPRSIEDHSLERIEAQTLWRAIRRLGEDEQQLLYLRFFLEMPLEEVAESMSIPTGTVKSRLHRTLLRLKGVIERDFPELKKEFEPGHRMTESTGKK